MVPARKILLMHECWRDEFNTFLEPHLGLIDFRGCEIRFSPFVPMYARRWKFPGDPHFIYEPSDEDWCRFFGIGREVDNGPAVYLLNFAAAFPPSFAEQLMEQMK